MGAQHQSTHSTSNVNVTNYMAGRGELLQPDESSIVVLDIYATGHHEQYIREVAAAWESARSQNLMQVVVPQKLIQPESRTSPGLHTIEGRSLRFIPLESLVRIPPGPVAPLRADRIYGRLLEITTAQIRPRRVLLMYFDHCQLSLSLRRPVPTKTRISGIYFRPSFHYRTLAYQRDSGQQRFREWRKRFLLRLALAHPNLSSVLCLDPYAVDELRRRFRRPKFIHLHDIGPTETESSASGDLRSRIGVLPEDRVVLLFGSLSARKGVAQFLEALDAMDVPQGVSISAVIAGPCDPADLLDGLESAGKNRKQIRVRRLAGVVPDDDLPELFRMAAVVALPYQRHIGSSGVLIRAAAAGRPVVTQDHGLVGRWVRDYRLGASVDTAKPIEIGRALSGLLRNPCEMGFDEESARAFARDHTSQRFRETILSTLVES